MSPRGSRRLLLFLMVVSCAPATIKPTPVAVRQGVYHSVRPGENLFRIAQAYNLTYEELARANNIREPHRIYVGQRLLIPGREAVARSVEPAASRPQSDIRRVFRPADSAVTHVKSNVLITETVKQLARFVRQLAYPLH